MRQRLILSLQHFLKRRYNKEIVAIKDPFRDMRLLVAGFEVLGVVDGGAYHGEIAKRLQQVFPTARVYAFEPATSAFATLKQEVNENPYIKPIKLALSSHGGKSVLYLNAQDSTNALSLVSDEGERYQSWQTQNLAKEEIELCTLDVWLRENDAKRIDVIKLDLQGHELEALRGAKGVLQSTVKLIYIEVEFVRIYQENCLLHEIVGFLEEIGFTLYQLYNLTSGEDGQIVCGDALFVHRDRLQF